MKILLRKRIYTMTAKTVVWKGETFKNYTIDEEGRVYSLNTKSYLKPARSISMNGLSGRPSIPIGLLMSEMFLDGNPVKHKDGDNTNNKLENLEPILKLNGKPIKKKEFSTKCMMKDFETREIIEIFNSVREAQRKTGIDRSVITNSMKRQVYTEKDDKKYLFEKPGGVIYTNEREIEIYAKPVLQTKKDGTQITFKSQDIAKKKLDITSGQLLDLIRSGDKHKIYGYTLQSLGLQKILTTVPKLKKMVPVIVPEMNLQDGDEESCEDEKIIFVEPGWYPVENFENYEISPEGKLRRTKTEEEIKINPGEYFRITLRNNGEKWNTRIHIIVAKQWIPNPHNLKYVNHKDGNKHNNNVTNLEWVTQQLNILHSLYRLKSNKMGRRVQKTTRDETIIFPSIAEAALKSNIKQGTLRNHIDDDKEYKDAMWTYLDKYNTDDSGKYVVLEEFPQYKIYNCSKIWSNYKNRCLTPQENSEGYMSIGLLDKKGLLATMFIHRLVAIAFVKGTGNVVNHKDNNRKNNSYKNLEWCTQSENMIHAFLFGQKQEEMKGIVKRDYKTGKIIATFKSMTEASETLNNPISNISHACQNRTQSKGYFWDYIENKDKDVVYVANTKLKVPILQKDDQGNIIAEYPSIIAAARKMEDCDNEKNGAIYIGKSIKSCNKQYGFYWSRKM